MISTERNKFARMSTKRELLAPLWITRSPVCSRDKGRGIRCANNHVKGPTGRYFKAQAGGHVIIHMTAGLGKRPVADLRPCKVDLDFISTLQGLTQEGASLLPRAAPRATEYQPVGPF